MKEKGRSFVFFSGRLFYLFILFCLLIDSNQTGPDLFYFIYILIIISFYKYINLKVKRFINSIVNGVPIKPYQVFIYLSIVEIFY